MGHIVIITCMCDDESAFTYSLLLLVMSINFSVLFWCSTVRAVGADGFAISVKEAICPLH